MTPRYWVKGCWFDESAEAFDYAVGPLFSAMPFVWRIHDGWNPENGATLVARGATYLGFSAGA